MTRDSFRSHAKEVKTARQRVDSRESHSAGLFGLEQKLNFASALVALPLLSVHFLSSMVAFPM
jgi:hypothetical protein